MKLIENFPKDGKKSDLTISLISTNEYNDICSYLNTNLKYFKDLNIDIIVTNNLCDDETEKLKTIYDVNIIKNEIRKGYAYNHNQNFAYSNSKYFLVSNADIQIKSYVKETIDELECHDVIVPKFIDEDGNITNHYKGEPSILYYIIKLLKIKSPLVLPIYNKIDNALIISNNNNYTKTLSGSFFIIKSEIFKMLGGFDVRYFLYFEDYDFGFRLKKIPGIYVSKNLKVYHAKGEAHKMSLKWKLIFLQSYLKYLLKWKI